jgi:hypothetical protein
MTAVPREHNDEVLTIELKDLRGVGLSELARKSADEEMIFDGMVHRSFNSSLPPSRG